jgi:mono/diheme cytochrome c family protein
MSNIKVLLAVIAVCAVFVAACAKQSESTTSTSATSEATSAATTASSNMSSEASMAKLPIPLAKLPVSKVAAGDVSAGSKVFAANCESCHGAGGKNGQVGPSLYGAGLKAGQVAYMVKSPTAIEKDSGMPKLPLTDKQIADVAAYVASLK